MGQLTILTRPVLEPLDALHQQLLQLCDLHRDSQARLHWQATNLLEGQAGHQFGGMTASAFSDAVWRYLQASEKLMQQIETFAQHTRSCLTGIEDTINDTERKVGGNERVLERLLVHVDLNNLLSAGESAIQFAINSVTSLWENIWENGVQMFEMELLALKYIGPLLVEWGAAVWHAIQGFLGMVADFLGQFGRATLELFQEMAHLLGVSEKIMESSFVKSLIKDILEKLGSAEELERVLKVTKYIPVLDILMFIPNTLIDIFSHPLTPREIEAAIIGNTLQVVVGSIPVVGEVVAVAAVVDAGTAISAQAQADFLRLEASLAPPQLRQQLLAEAQRHQTIAENADKFGDIFDDIGLILVDDMAKQPAPSITSPDTLFDAGFVASGSPGFLLGRLGYDTLFTAYQGDYQLVNDFSALGSDLAGAAFAPFEFSAENSGLWMLNLDFNEGGW